jgi:arylsulfatase A-like enzyme
MRAAPLCSLGLVCGLSWLGACGPSETADLPGRRPNILLVSIDSLRADHLGCYGYPRETSPVIDGLAAEGALFRTVVSPSSWTLPAHATLFTSLPPESHGLTYDTKALGEGALCLAEVLNEAGYATAGFVAGPFLRELHGFAQGFEHYDDQTVMKPLLESHAGATSPDLMALANQWLAERDAEGDERPFFIFLHLWDVHYDYEPPAPYDTLFDPDYLGSMTSRDFQRNKAIQPGMDPVDLAHVVALYDGEIAYTDQQLGGFLDGLRRAGVLDETLVVVTADHGDEFFEHGNKGHRKTLFDESLLVPLVLRYPPAVPAGTLVGGQVHLGDVAPTLLSLAGVPMPGDFGLAQALGPLGPRNLAPLLRPDAAPVTGPVFGDHEGVWSFIRTEGFKLVSRPEQDGGDLLFDLTTDPSEQRPLEGHDRRRAKLRARLRDWHALWQGRPQVGKSIVLDDDQIKSLRSLGYIR